MVVFLPSPFTPTSKIICGVSGNCASNSAERLTGFSIKRLIISSRSNVFNSSLVTYLSLETRSSMRRIISRVVFTPTSEVIKISSSSSRMASSIWSFPAIAFPSLFSKPLRLSSTPFSKVVFFLKPNFFEV